jgi:hypothetical protein
METISGGGALTQDVINAINRNFSELDARTVGGASGRGPKYVDPVSGSDGNDGSEWSKAFRTITKAVALAVAGDVFYLAPGRYDEALITVSRKDAANRDLNNLQFVGVGGRGSVFIEPSTEDQGGMVVHADDVTLINIGVAAEDETSAVALTVTGARFRAYGCKIEGGASQIVIGPGTDAQITAGTRGDGADALFRDCEICWGTNGIVLTASDYGAVTQPRFERCRFHDLSAASFEEAGGSVDIRFRGLVVDGCIFEPNEDGTIPTKYLSLNDDNTNAGVVADCQFPCAINSGNNLVSTAVLWVANKHTGGISTGQPS